MLAFLAPVHDSHGASLLPANATAAICRTVNCIVHCVVCVPWDAWSSRSERCEIMFYYDTRNGDRSMQPFLSDQARLYRYSYTRIAYSGPVSGPCAISAHAVLSLAV